MAPVYILGISAFYHDSAACLLRDGKVVAAAQEERFSRIKGDSAFPVHAIRHCLESESLTSAGLAEVSFYEKPLLRFERILETFTAIAPRGFPQFLHAGPLWVGEKIFTDKNIRDGLGEFHGRILYPEHHESHAASAFYPSPFSEAAILTVDGVGEWATASLGVGRGAEIEILRELRWPDSLGLLYSAFTYQAGFKVNSGEYKLMGLAPYGEPRYVRSILDHLMDLRDDGSFTLDQRYFDYVGGLKMTSAAFDHLFDGPPRLPESRITQREMDLARSVQVVCEEVLLRMARTAHRLTGLDSLCIAGGVGLNAVANGRISREGPFRHLWIQPAAGDAGGALGAAMLAWHRYRGMDRVAEADDSMSGAYLGPSFDSRQIEVALRAENAVWSCPDPQALLDRVADLLATEQVVGWFQGRMEFGPRALGARSILADARSPHMQSLLNLKIKFREGFRPFAPSVLLSDAAKYFDLEGESPYMLGVAAVREERRLPQTAEPGAIGIDRLHEVRSDIPAATHIDYSARVQTVSRARNGRFHALLEAFRERTGCSVLVNTSFNVRGEPIVCTPSDAYRCFMRTRMDYLVIWPFLLAKGEQPIWSEEGREHGPASGKQRPREQRRAQPTAAEGRAFAWPVGIALGGLGLLLWLRGSAAAGIPGLLGIILLAAGAVVPDRLGPVIHTWTAFGRGLSRVTTPIVLGTIYFCVITPIGLGRRVFGLNPLARRHDTESFWVSRPRRPDVRREMERQF